jgi:predicted transcriptional regulator
VPGSLVGVRLPGGGGVLSSTSGASTWGLSFVRAEVPDPSYSAVVHAKEMAEEFPIIGCDSDAWDAVTELARHRLPGLVVTEATGQPVAILPASQVVRMLVPRYVQDDPSLAGVLSESMADRVADKLHGKTVRSLLPDDAPELAVVRDDDTIVEVAAVMARLRCPLAAVMTGDRIVGVITASRLLEVALRG